MPSIQVDMFEVQLGAAILLQFKVGKDVVRILADAGIKASGYPKDHVLKKLLPILSKGDGRLRIDLIIGTHYDEDHLNGLVSIIEHEDIEIGEAWMPPVANESQPHALDASLTEADLLAQQFYGDDGDDYLGEYLRLKRADVETLQVLEGKRDLQNDVSLTEFRSRRLAAHDENRSGSEIGFFREQINDLVGPDNCDHGTDQEIEPNPEVEQAIAQARRMPGLSPWWVGRLDLLNLDHFRTAAHSIRAAYPNVGIAQQQSLAHIRKGAAKDAINAVALHQVVKALRKKKIPIRTEIILDGEPRRYAWRTDLRRFHPAPQGGSSPILTLLGPSRGLVRKHWDRLPVELASRVALSFLSEIKAITPSNQLSYIARLEHQKQGILVSGDAGCVDFALKRNIYHQKLLDVLLPLHVIQVAHHGGNNAHFYRVLEAAGYPAQIEHSLLLLSHATQDKHRPSEEFRSFLLGTMKEGDDVRLLFTGRPQTTRSKDFTSAFHPVVGNQAEEGDVRIAFDGQRWEVKSHAVAP